jgi:hypothetical protein
LLGWLDGCWATTRDKIQIRDGKKVIFPKGWKKINKGWKKIYAFFFYGLG